MRETRTRSGVRERVVQSRGRKRFQCAGWNILVRELQCGLTGVNFMTMLKSHTHVSYILMLVIYFIIKYLNVLTLGTKGFLGEQVCIQRCTCKDVHYSINVKSISRSHQNIPI